MESRMDSGTSMKTPETRFFYRAADYLLPIYDKTFVMGILNVTPDSFSDGGKYYSVTDAVDHAKHLVDAGAHIIDVGGESTRPGHTPVSTEEEIERILPVIRALKQTLDVPISVDTWKSSVALVAVEIARVAAQTGAGLIMMFNAFDPELVRKSGDIVSDALEYLAESIRIARKSGMSDDQMMIDPGIGFGVSPEESLELIRALPSFRDLGFPVLIGPSRKRFIGAVLDEPVERRLIGTVAACCVGACLGANVVRVHDVAEIASAMKMKDAITNI